MLREATIMCDAHKYLALISAGSLKFILETYLAQQ